jgi:hypothetical protein
MAAAALVWLGVGNGLTPMSENQGYLVPKPPSGLATSLSKMNTVSLRIGSFCASSCRRSKLAFAAPQPEAMTALRSPALACSAALMPARPLKKSTCTMSLPSAPV